MGHEAIAGRVARVGKVGRVRSAPEKMRGKRRIDVNHHGVVRERWRGQEPIRENASAAHPS